MLAAPGGTRMYGLTRREAMQAAFPPRSFHAYDWFLVLGLIQKGPQIEIPDVLLYRDRTAVRAYVDAAAREIPDWLAAWPVLPMSARALKDGRVPMRAIGDLVKLNLRKHEEHLAHRKPEQFTRRIALFRWLGLPIASRPEMTRKIAEELVRDAPDRRKGAAKLLRRLLARGDGDAAYSLGQFQKGGLIDGDARNTFRRGAELGNADAAFEWALLKRSDGDIPEADFWSRIVYAAEGSAAARQFLDEARQSGALPTTLEAVAQHLQAS